MLQVLHQGLMDIPIDGIGTLLGGVTFVVGIATTYLRLFVSKEMSNLKDQLTASTDAKIDRMMEEFHPKDVVDGRFRYTDAQIEHLKSWMDWFHGTKMASQTLPGSKGGE